ncbi:metalloregulator ArsR/SmtB family transcription factor [Pedococcus sp.]|uniref:ArsR/SmtB family transcription factor n=1 Tax=Pedococcus sp. TaxID=2860345 RepID=UPI002E107510|nr:metalloregulator ArsR/SmtB family transcription factor [Pedococcus sp.]
MVHTQLLTTTSGSAVTGDDACCGTLTSDSAMGRAQAEATAYLLKAVADPARLQLLSLIRASKDQEACVCDLTPAVGLSQPTVSHHLKVLTEAGLVTRERRGTWAWFRLVPRRLEDLAAIFR